uniref:NADH dehydrogenase subunit 4L n=1 Tax=Balta hwangorum TaxID=2163940 RepID=UPI0027A498D5|nr:NADH dehydrogenase subunit 4L [Balta hwangorum]YP_010946436.1 NADH dehydrogenase subunit 4L [Balta dissecta]WGO57089.1 NADH dehydrogenase subunit 4L [Balta hwangorum]WGO57154.1 NADH dehydrogenase subunit 4L [Balta dissecta]
MSMYFGLMFFCGVWVFCSSRKHLLIVLLSLEFIVLIIYIIFYYYLFIVFSELFVVAVFLTFSVCEGALGLSILVSMIRSFGNDYLYSYSMLQC